MDKLHVAIIFGGKSAEHEISIRSAQSIINYIDKSKYHIHLIFINKAGNWKVMPSSLVFDFGKPLNTNYFTQDLAFSGVEGRRFFVPAEGNNPLKIDVIFPVLHGPYGEDGTVQGLFRVLQLPFVGCDVMGSAAGMDKDVMKRLLIEAGIPIGKYLACYAFNAPAFEEVETQLGLPVYIKPARMGSSVGISKVNNEAEYIEACKEAFRYDHKIVIEENINGMEIECAVLGNRFPEASTVGRIISYHDFYTYDSKYLDDKGFKIEIPAEIAPESIEAVRMMAIRVFKAVEAEGLGRVDVFLKDNGDILVNEINTLPGFTNISMYPMLWEKSGLTYTELIDRLIGLAIERWEADKQLTSSI
jgi:D-alanine-D-alanine ligase